MAHRSVSLPDLRKGHPHAPAGLQDCAPAAGRPGRWQPPPASQRTQRIPPGPPPAPPAATPRAPTESPAPALADGNDNDPLGPRIYVCTYCKKRFARPGSLQTHLDNHTGESPFECPVPGCGRRFSNGSNLRRHLRDRHTEYGAARALRRPRARSSPSPSLSPGEDDSPPAREDSRGAGAGSRMSRAAEAP